MTSHVFVRNNGDQTFSDAHNGVVFDFVPGVEIQISEVAAKHIFGYGDDDKEPYLVRLGWMKMNTDFPLAMEKLGKFSFSREPSKPVHLSAPVVERVAAPLPKARGAAKVALTENE
jgi:hypothetical protein